ncbi:MAG TPA: GGDEF domain-containing protein [Candidatus Paceibacterota bacterium]|nr:GGDEF domain-containing protein [Candidatus Paceibacterota bacterium]
MSENPKFERPTTPEEENNLILARSRYLLEHIAEREKEHSFDYLTGLKKREIFDRELERLLDVIRGEAKEKRKGVEPPTEVSLIAIDIDHFKQVNDTLGHQAGDAVLQKIGELLTRSIRHETDMAVRMGGEEFMVLMPGASVEIAANHAERLRAEIEKLVLDEYPELKITASFGVVSSESSTDLRALQKLVDDALYRAKDNGRNRVEV